MTTKWRGRSRYIIISVLHLTTRPERVTVSRYQFSPYAIRLRFHKATDLSRNLKHAAESRIINERGRMSQSVTDYFHRNEVQDIRKLMRRSTPGRRRVTV